MVNTRSQHANGINENNAANPPPPLTLEQVLLMQAQMLQTMQQMMANMHQGQGHQQITTSSPWQAWRVLEDQATNIFTLC
jgi:type II secretory pathway component PulL